MLRLGLERCNDLIRGVWRALVVERLFTMIAYVLGAIILLAVPQVSNLVWQFPPLAYISGDWPFYVLFYLYIATVVLLFGALWSMLIPPQNLVGGPGERVAEVMVRLLERSERRRCAVLGVAMLVAGMIWLVAGLAGRDAADGPLRWLHSSLLWALVLICLGAWVTAASGATAVIGLAPRRLTRGYAAAARAISRVEPRDGAPFPPGPLPDSPSQLPAQATWTRSISVVQEAAQQASTPGPSSDSSSRIPDPPLPPPLIEPFPDSASLAVGPPPPPPGSPPSGQPPFLPPPPGGPRIPIGRLGYRMNMAGRALTVLLVLALIDWLIWKLPWWVPAWASFRTYTIWAVFLIVFLLVAAARLVDAWHRTSGWNVRAVVTAVVVVGVLTMPAERVGRVVKSPPVQMLSGGPNRSEPELLSESWFDSFENRLNNMPSDTPVVFVAASGGGSRAALFTTMVLESLRTTRGIGVVARDPVVPNPLQFMAPPASNGAALTPGAAGLPLPGQPQTSRGGLQAPRQEGGAAGLPLPGQPQPPAPPASRIAPVMLPPGASPPSRLTDATQSAIASRLSLLATNLINQFPEDTAGFPDPAAPGGVNHGLLRDILSDDAIHSFLTTIAAEVPAWGEGSPTEFGSNLITADEWNQLKVLVDRTLASLPAPVPLPFRVPQVTNRFAAQLVRPPTPKIVSVLPVLPDTDPPVLEPATRPGEGPSPAVLVPREATLTDHIALISSVSGGSLATGYYLHRNFPHFRSFAADTPYSYHYRSEPIQRDEKSRDAWQSSYRRELFLRVRDLARQKLETARNGRSLAFWTSSDEFIDVVGKVEAESERLAGGRFFDLQIARWLPRSTAFDDMGTDFMAPLLRGVLDPATERGVSVSRFWEDRFGWERLNERCLHLQPLSQRVPLQATGEQGVMLWPNDAPVALFNSTDVQSGSRLIIGFPPLPPSLVSDPVANPTRGGPYSISDRGDWYHSLDLAEAVRLSANFPWGFEVARLPLRNGADTVLALDGGIVDNSGIDSIVHLVRGLTAQAVICERLLEGRLRGDLAAKKLRHADRVAARQGFYYEVWLDGSLADLEKSRAVNRMQVRAFRVVRELRRRGVMVIHIDSGSKRVGIDREGIFAWLASLVPSAFRPFQALNNASYTNADLSTLDYDVVLDALLRPERSGPGTAPEDGDVGQPASPPIVQRVQLVCNNSENIMTAWSLGPADKAQVILQFLIEWVNQEPYIRESLQTVQETVRAYREGNVKSLRVLDDHLVRLRKSKSLSSAARKQFYNPTASEPTEPLAAAGTNPGADQTFQELLEALRKARASGLRGEPTPALESPFPAVPLPPGVVVPNATRVEMTTMPPTPTAPAPEPMEPPRPPAVPEAAPPLYPPPPTGDGAPPPSMVFPSPPAPRS